jgi:acyl-CoA thioesterase-1
MTCSRLTLAASILLLFAAWAMAQAPARPQRAQNRAQQPEFAQIKDDPKLPRVLLIGDSISIGYTLPTRELLKGKANLHRIPTNGGPTINGLANLDKWLGEGKWDVIHFNWGLHDLKQDEAGQRQVPLEQYERNLAQLVSRLKKTGAQLIWASTTPVPEGNVSPVRVDTDVVAYNAAAARIMKEQGVEIDDLYSLALPKLKEIQRPVNVHFTPAGSQILAQQVADKIADALK